MKRLWARLLAGAVFAAVALLGCDGGGGVEDSRGQVIDKRHEDGTYELKVDGVIAHGRTIWWEEVTSRVYANCQVGDTWDEDDPDGCS